jgi:hypothetical protein
MNLEGCGRNRSWQLNTVLSWLPKQHCLPAALAWQEGSLHTDYTRTVHGDNPEGVEVQPFSFFNLGARWGWVVNATPQPFTPEMTRCLLYRKLGRSGAVWTTAKISAHRDSIPDRPAIPAHRNKYSVGKMQCHVIVSGTYNYHWVLDASWFPVTSTPLHCAVPSLCWHLNSNCQKTLPEVFSLTGSPPSAS